VPKSPGGVIHTGAAILYTPRYTVFIAYQVLIATRFHTLVAPS